MSHGDLRSGGQQDIKNMFIVVYWNADASENLQLRDLFDRFFPIMIVSLSNHFVEDNSILVPYDIIFFNSFTNQAKAFSDTLIRFLHFTNVVYFRI